MSSTSAKTLRIKNFALDLGFNGFGVTGEVSFNSVEIANKQIDWG